MKLVFGMAVVLVTLLGMILGIGHLDGLTLGEPSEEPAASAGTDAPAEAETPVEADGPAEAETPAEQEPGPAMATGEEVAYLESIMGLVGSVGNGINQVGSLLAEPAFEDETWRAQITALLVAIEKSPDAISEVIPPPALQGFHDASLLLTEHCSSFAVLVYESLKEGESEPSEEAMVELAKADEAFVEMDSLLSEFLTAHPVEQE